MHSCRVGVWNYPTTPWISDSATDHTTYVTQLRTAMRCLQAVPTWQPQHRRTHISNDLATCTHVFVRNDAVRKPLHPPYNGPFLVVGWRKHYTIDYKGQPTTISLDRIKVAHPDSAPPNPHPEPRTEIPPTSFPSSLTRRATCSGCHVHWPDHLVHSM